jgi:hypothetical protein
MDFYPFDYTMFFSLAGIAANNPREYNASLSVH